jgi:deoxyuridine 5'-triphosphate nucleotidohydrolase
MKVSEEALNHLKSLQVDPTKLSEEEYFMATHIQMPRLIYRGPNANPLPAYQTEQSSCFDVLADEYVTIQPKSYVVIRTGLYLTMEDAAHFINLNPAVMNLALVLRERSGLAAKGIGLGAGEIDRDYLIENNPENEIKVILRNFSEVPLEVKAGDRICQAKWELVLKDPFLETKNHKRIGGLGSTGT